MVPADGPHHAASESSSQTQVETMSTGFEGAPAPLQPGTDDLQSFHQPPAVVLEDYHSVDFAEAPVPSPVTEAPAGALHVGTPPDHALERPSDGIRPAPSTPTRPGPPPRLPSASRVRFPEEPGELEQRISSRRAPPGSPNRPHPPHSPLVPSNEPAVEEEKVGQEETVAPEPKGLWQGFRRYLKDLKDDFGAADSHKDTSHIVGDTGIDLQTLRKLQSHNRTSSLIGSALLLSGPGLGRHHHLRHYSTSSTLAPSEPSTPGTSTPATPGTPWKRFQDGLDPKELSKALKNIKKKIEHGASSREAKYVQAKSDIASRRTLCLLLTYAFMLYGAPSHRIEEYILQLFKICELDGRVNYTVGCTEICFINPPDPNDPMTLQSYTTLVKAQGLDVGALEVAFRIYKDIVHGDIAMEEAVKSTVKLIESPPYHKPWVLVPFYGLASAFAAVWAYNGWWTDMPIAFVLGTIVGFLQIIVASRNPLYANVLETSAALVTSFGARAFATIGGGGRQQYFCFGAIAESAITTILPGYIVLCGALELQSKSLTAGSTRLFYAVIYSLFLGYGIDIGAQLWAIIDPSAPTSPTCPRTVDPRWKILLVPCYLVFQATLIRSRPKQIPVQVLFGSAAYCVNYFVAQYATSQVADSASAFVLGLLGHLYARSRHAFAFASVVAGIMVLVPSGLSAQGGLIAGISTPLFNNGTTNAQEVYEKNLYQSFSVGAQMIQVAIGLSVGLFVSAIFIYPLGRKNNALFSF